MVTATVAESPVSTAVYQALPKATMGVSSASSSATVAEETVKPSAVPLISMVSSPSGTSSFTGVLCMSVVAEGAFPGMVMVASVITE